MSERKEVYVLGHRNPDTDSICSAIAYADVKNKENDGNHYVAARAGQISSETSYVLQRFGMRSRPTSTTSAPACAIWKSAKFPASTRAFP